MEIYSVSMNTYTIIIIFYIEQRMQTSYMLC